MTFLDYSDNIAANYPYVMWYGIAFKDQTKQTIVEWCTANCVAKFLIHGTGVSFYSREDCLKFKIWFDETDAFS